MGDIKNRVVASLRGGDGRSEGDMMPFTETEKNIADIAVAELTRLRAREADLLARAEQAEFGAAEDARKIEAMAATIEAMLAEDAPLRARAEKAEARVAWLERPVTQNEQDAFVFFANKNITYDMGRVEVDVNFGLTAALKIRMEPTP